MLVHTINFESGITFFPAYFTIFLRMISTITLLSQVGFDAGDGVNFFAIPESQTADVVNVVSSSNIDINGMRLYKLSDAQICK